MMSRQGAERAAELERLYRARHGVFLRVAVAVLRDEQLAEEAVHDGFVRALRHRRSFDGRGAVEAWVWRIVPPGGSLFVAAGERLGVLQVDGMQVAIEASGEAAILAAARALVPLPG